jgi:hypothetical protein
MIAAMPALRSFSLAMLLGAISCSREPPLAQRMAGPWRATIEYGARTSNDPLVRGMAKFFNPRGGRLHILLEVGAETIEVKRPSAKADQEITQRASFVALDRERIELTTERGRLVARVHLECNKEACLAVQFDPEPGADLQAKEAMGFLFGCDDDSGNIDCASAPRARMFYRYAPGAP